MIQREVKWMVVAATVVVGLGLTACSKKVESTSKLQGTVAIDGSSTVFPITEAVAEEFRKVQPDVRVTVGVSGTGGGFKKFVVGETDINDASRTIKSKESEKAKKHKINFIEIPVAYDGISVVVSKENTWVDSLSVKELRMLWKPQSQIKKWNQIRPEWPDREIKLYGPGTDSGTFDYFTEVINGKSHSCRSDFTKSEDDNVLVQGIVGDKDALGFFGYAYYYENRDRIRVIPIDNGKGPIKPSLETINNGTYAPLSRPIFIYVNKDKILKPEISEFVLFYLRNAPSLVKEVGYVPLSSDDYNQSIQKVESNRKS